jgi:hypothetical protein
MILQIFLEMEWIWILGGVCALYAYLVVHRGSLVVWTKEFIT